MSLLFLLDLTGTFFFAVSGALVALRKNMDLFGVIVLGCVTAIGGGTLREILLGQFPPFVLRQDLYLYVAIIGSILTYLFIEYYRRVHSIGLLADALGLGTFVSIGVTRALEANITPIGAIVLGTISAIAGGMLRDVLAGEIPYVLTRDFYAITCILGGIVYLILVSFHIPQKYIMAIVTVFVVVLRILAIRYNWKLPRKKLKRLKDT